MKSGTERAREFKERMKAQGFIQVNYWILKENKAKADRCMKRLKEKK